MKKLIIFVLLLGFGVANAEYTGPTATKQGTFKTTIITPFSIVNDQQTSDESIPPVVAGTTRNLDADEGGLYIFKIEKEQGYYVDFIFSGDNTVGGVTINARWYWTYKHPGSVEPGSWTAIPSTWVWGPGSDEMDPIVDGTNGTVRVYAFLRVNSVTAASGIAAGERTFTVHASGQYRDL